MLTKYICSLIFILYFMLAGFWANPITQVSFLVLINRYTNIIS
jgi:hypothetical protein